MNKETVQKNEFMINLPSFTISGTMLFPSFNLTQKVTAGYGNKLVSFLVVLTDVCLDINFLPRTRLVLVTFSHVLKKKITFHVQR